MSLDLRTMMVMIAVLTLLFSGLLALAGLHAGNIRGIRQWAMASLCMSAGLAFTIIQTTPHNSGWAFVSGATLVTAGISLQYAGIRAFKEQSYHWQWGATVIGLVFVLSLWFVFIHPDNRLRAIANSVVFASMSAACARALLIRIQPPLRTAYWFTGTSFAVLALVFAIRTAVIAGLPEGTYRLYSPMLINPVTFFVSSVAQLCLTFGFVLMLNYRLATELHDLAAQDALTGAFNRRSLESEAERLLARCSRTGSALAIMLLDIDHFKAINDHFGHPAGDAVLQRLVEVAQGTIRTDDYFARYGGEEFCILLPSSTEDEVLGLAERLRENYAALTMEVDGEPLRSTISIGVADSRKTGLKFSTLLAAVDQALYRAKQDGRNRVVAYSTLGMAA